MSGMGSMHDKLRMRLNRDEGMKNLDKVILDHGSVEGEKWSFKDHEYQIEILRDTAQRIDVRKCSQVGLSELMVQKTLGTLVVMPHIRIIYTLPTEQFALKFSKDRIDGAINASDHYSAMISAGENSASFKKIGDSMLYVGGTYGAKAAISIPAEIIISDEVDFSNAAVLGKLNSRIRHAKAKDSHGNRGYRYRFSTPTVDGYGIDLGFQAGDQRYYLCKCEHCEHWVLPEYEKHFVVPGFTQEIKKFTRDDLYDTRFEPSKAWIRCDHCGKDLLSSLLQPARRQWVAKCPDNWDHSYQVSPWDVPAYNTPPEIIKQVADYPLTSDYFNFVLGLPYSDSENTFNTTLEHRTKQCRLDLWILGAALTHGMIVGGMDVGKRIHLVVKIRVARAWHIIWMEKIENTVENPAFPRIIDRYDEMNMSKLCIDAGPDITLVNLLVGARQGIQAVVYTNVRGIMPIEPKGDGKTINADRTKTLTLLLEDHNYGRLVYPREQALQIELYQHLATTKKISEKNTDGTLTQKFIKTDKNDHWVHSLNYANIAGLCMTMLGEVTTVYGPTTVGRAAVGSQAPSRTEDRKDEPKNGLTGLFGIGRARAKLPGRRR